MRVLYGVSALLTGCLILAAVWCNVVCTALPTGRRPALPIRPVLRWVPSLILALARALPRRARSWVLNLIGPFVFFSVLAWWLAASLAGFALIVVSFGGVPAIPAGLIPWSSCTDAAAFAAAPVTQWRSDAIALMAWTNAAIIVLIFAVHLMCFLTAYRRRELAVRVLATQARWPPDAERLLIPYLRSGMTAALDDQFAQWARWLGDVRATHHAYPALMFCRSSPPLNWLTAAVIMLDAAAAIDALAPSWAPPHTRTLLCTGMRCMQSLLHQSGISHPAAIASFEGREEVEFHATMRKLVTAGLPEERDEAHASMAFQKWRIQYSPYATAIAIYLLYDDPGIDVPTCECME